LLDKSSTEYFNFINSLNSERTKKLYAYCLRQFLEYSNNVDLHSFLIDPVQQKEKLIIEYLVQRKVSAPFKNVILATIRHACEINDVVLNWKKIKKFTKSQKTGNEIVGKDRGYTHEEIQTILEFSDQRLKTAFLILASTGIRIGALGLLRIGDLERIEDLYKVTVYSGDKEQYITFTTPEATKEIDAYLEFRKRRGENITNDSYLLVKKFSLNEKSVPYKGYSLRSILQFNIENTGLRQIGSRSKRKETPVLHAFRKFFTKQLHDSKVDAAIMQMLLGHDIGLIGRYYKPTPEEMYEEYCKAIDNLTIDPSKRLQREVKTLQVEKSLIEDMNARLQELERKR